MMRKFVTSILPFFAVAAIAVAVLIAFSFTNSYVARFTQRVPQGVIYTGDLSGKTQLALDADTLFGSNMMNISAGTFVDSMLAQNPSGPRATASNTMSISLDAKNTGVSMFGSAVNQIQKEIPSYTETDLKTVPDTQQSLDAFAQGFIAAVNQNLVPFKGKDILELSYQIETNNDADARKTLIAYVDATQHMINATKAMDIPQSWGQTMTQYLNLMAQIRYTALALLVQQSDPLRATIMTYNYQTLLSKTAQVGSMIQTGMQKLGYAI